MEEQNKRERRIIEKLNTNKVQHYLKENDFKNLGKEISSFLHHIFSLRINKKSLNWCFSNIKRIKIFLQIFHANESQREIYKEEIAKKIPEYSYKTIAKIIDDGLEKGYYVLLSPDGLKSKDGKIKNIRPSEELVTDFLNLSIDVISYIEKNNPK